MRQLFISIAVFIAAIVFFLLEAPSLPATKTNNKQMSPVAPQPKSPHLDSLSKVKERDTIQSKI
jgi:hypothetical protein